MSTFKIAVVDCETTVKNNKIGNFKANPHHPDNEMVSIGVLNVVTGTYGEGYHNPNSVVNINNVLSMVKSILSTYDMIVGHNIKFDLLYFKKQCPQEFFEFVARGGVVWDTMVCDYILSGQTNCFTPLSSEYRLEKQTLGNMNGAIVTSIKKILVREGLAVRYGGTDKLDKIKEYWDSGVETEDIPRDELLAYQKGDVMNTALIFEKQMEEVVNKRMTAITTVTMDALLALTEIEHNGMHFDQKTSRARASELENKLFDCHLDVMGQMLKEFPNNVDTKINPDSDTQISKLLFGGKMTVRGTQPIIGKDGLPMHYKSGIHKGKPRTKLKKEVIVHKGWLSDIEKRNKKGDHPVGDEVLQELLDNDAKYNLELYQVDLIRKIQKSRSYRKEMSTYFVGYAENTWMHDGCIHPNYNQVITPTGRFSCTNPNLQNVKRDE